MAHADYACCACCDSKEHYDSNAWPKEVLCASCAVGLSKRLGRDITSPKDLLQAVKDIDILQDCDYDQKLCDALVAQGFRRCCYGSEIDDAVRDRFHGWKGYTLVSINPVPAPHTAE